MTRQAFAFGCAYNDSRLVGPQAQSSDSHAYRAHFLELFNTGVDELAMKWPNWQNPASRRSALQSLQWMRRTSHRRPRPQHHLAGLASSSIRLPQSLANDPAALESRIDDHIHDITDALAGQVIEWDVVNEPYSNHDLMHILGDDAVAGWFKLAAQCDPVFAIYLNEPPSLLSRCATNVTMCFLTASGLAAQSAGPSAESEWNQFRVDASDFPARSDRDF